MQKKKTILIVGVLLGLVLTACQLPVQMVYLATQQPAPDQTGESKADKSSNLMETISALETRVADIGTASAQSAFTSTLASSLASPTAAVVTATPVPVTPIISTPVYAYAPGSGAPCNRATFVQDVTIGDGAQISAGAGFTKTWRIRNTGFCTWTTAYSLVFDHGNSMGSTLSVPLTAQVVPGSTVDLSVNLVAPSADGIYQGNWMLQDANGVRFGIGTDASRSFWVKISIGVVYYNPPDSYTAPYYPYYDPNNYPYNYYPRGCQVVAVSPPMYTNFSPGGDTDIKWTIRNISGATWDHNAIDYEYVGGTKMYKNNSIYDLPNDVNSGDTIDIIVDTILPSTRGTYTTTWALVQNSATLCTMSISLRVY